MRTLIISLLVAATIGAAQPTTASLVWDGEHPDAGEEIREASLQFLEGVEHYVGALQTAEGGTVPGEQYDAFVRSMMDALEAFTDIQGNFGSVQVQVDADGVGAGQLSDIGIEPPASLGELSQIAIEQIESVLDVATERLMYADSEVQYPYLLELNQRVFKALEVGIAVAAIVAGN